VSIVSMGKKPKRLILDFTQEDAVSSIMPCTFIASSDPLRWDRISVQHHRQPAWETPEFCSYQHLVLVKQNEQPVKFEQVVGQHYQDGVLTYQDLVIIPAHVPCRVSWDREMEFILLVLDPICLAQVVDDSTNSNNIEILPQVAVFDPNISLSGALLKSELFSQALGSSRHIEAVQRLLSITLLRQFSVRKVASPDQQQEQVEDSLQRAIAYINENLVDELSLKAIAAVAQMSPFYFARLFKRATSLTPNQYVTNRRMERAKQLLIEQDLSVVDIAQEVGIQSQSHFNKVFREYTGVTPKAYRNNR
jgi:AraC family transcriptional regulator